MATPAAILQILVTADSASALKVMNATDRRLSRSASAAERHANKVADVVSKTAKLGALGVAGGLAASVRAAADFESHFAEVRKTVNTNAAGFAKLEAGIRRMARTIPVSANELADLAGEAGALGVRTKDLLRFTRTSAELGIATNLSSEEAGNALARLSNIMGTSGKDVRRFGSTLVRLGNNGASTESEIAAMALRIAGAGKQIGLSEAQVLSYSSALASVGIEAEAGGSAISRVFINIASAVNAGGKNLDGFAKVAGLSSSAYAKAFRADAAGATLRFVEGLDKMRRSGGDVFGTLEKLRLGEIRVRDALLRASGAGRLFREQLAIGNDEWRRNTALTREANQRYQTAAARLQRLKNQFVDWGISIGKKLLPHLTRMMDILSDDRLTTEEKFDRLSRLIGPLLSRGIEKGVQIVGQAGPKIVGALAAGIATAWTDMSPLAKLFTVGAILAAVGGRKAIVASGAAIGRTLGTGLATGASSAAAKGLVAGAGGGAAASAAGGALVQFGQYRKTASGLLVPAGAAAGQAAGAAAGSKFLPALAQRVMPLASRVGIAGLGIVLADRVISEFGARAASRSPDLLTALRGKLDMKLTGNWGLEGIASMGVMSRLLEEMAQRRVRINDEMLTFVGTQLRSVDLTKQQRAQVERTLALLRMGRSLRIGVDLGMNPTDLAKIRNNLDFLKSGWGSSMADILKVSRRNMALIRNTIGTNTADGRKLAAENMRATASAIEQAMDRAGTRTRAGMARVRELIRNANLIEPTRKQAEAFGRQWAAGMDRSREITKRGIREMIAEAQKMPGPMRKVALDVWMAQFDAARRNRTITTREFATLRSRVAAEFTGLRDASRGAASGVAGSITNLVNRATDGLSVLAGNVNKTLTAFGARALKFDLREVQAQHRQTGGVIVPGSGSGDKVPALLEPGEVVWNRKAVAAMGGARQVNTANKAFPRFQSGGIVGGIPDADGALPGLDALAMVMLQRFGLHVTAGRNNHSTYTTTGNVSDHSWGGAVDLSNGVTTPQEDAAYSYLTHAPISKAIKQILYRTMVGGNHFNHIHVALLPQFANDAAAVLGLLGAGDLPRLLLAGPDGALKSIGQGALEDVHRAGAAAVRRALASAKSLTGPGGTDTLGMTGNGADLMKQIAAARGWNFADWWTLDGRETNHGADIFNEASEAFNRAQFLPMNRGKYGPGSLPGASMIDQIYSMADYIAHRYGNPSAALAFHNAHNWYQRGGIVQGYQAGSRGLPRKIAPAIDLAQGFARRRRVPRPKRTRAVKHALSLIRDLGLSTARQRELFDLSRKADIANELAGRAADLSYDLVNPDGSPMLDADRRPMRHWEFVQGFDAPGWVRAQLDALMTLRNRLLEAERIVSREMRRVMDLIERTRRRLAAVQHKIADAAQTRRRLTGELRRAEDKLDRLGAHPRRNAAQIRALRARVGDLRDKLRVNDVEQRLNVRERDALRAILAGRDGDGGLIGKRDQLRIMRGNILGSGDSFKGLETVQGIGSPMEVMSALPPLGMLGGEIFDAHKTWRDYTTLPAPVVDVADSSADDSDSTALLQQLLTESQQRAFLANQQFAVLRNMPTLPFGGIFHTGGIVDGAPSQDYMTILRGREGVMTPQQMAVTSAALVGASESQSASRVEVVITDQRTIVKIDDEEVRAQVRDEVRQIARVAKNSNGMAGSLRR